MGGNSKVVTLTLAIATVLSVSANAKVAVLMSPEIVLEKGLVSNKNYLDIDFPRGHIGVKSVNAELVDERGNPVALDEAYLHHWVIQRYITSIRDANFSIVRNSGICDTAVTQYFGLGAETRKTATDIPDPYGIQVGDPAGIPRGYKEGWLLNVHAIDTRGTEDKMGCAECRCDLYNVTRDESVVARPSGYKGGVLCCPDQSRCRLKQGLHGYKRSIYLRYTVKYMDWDSSSMIPLKIYILDVTDVWTKADQSKEIQESHHCAVEYDIDSCDIKNDKNGCIVSSSVSVSLPSGGDVIYGVGHQHTGATGTTLYGEGGRVVCSSKPIYGEGNEVGNESGYIVGMTTCYPSPSQPIRIYEGEKLTLVSNYSSLQTHTGVMTLFYLLLDDSSPHPRARKMTTVPKFIWPVALLGVVFVLVVSKGKTRRTDGYEAML